MQYSSSGSWSMPTVENFVPGTGTRKVFLVIYDDGMFSW